MTHAATLTDALEGTMKRSVSSRLVSSLLSLGLLTATSLASATPVPENSWCRLSRTPFLLTSGMPADLRCAYDQDGNGLDDEVEVEIARCVAPELRFDTQEYWTRTSGFFKPCSPYTSNSHVDGCKTRAEWLADGQVFSATQVTEPHALFTIVRTGMDTLAVNYTILWSYDGGFVVDGGTGCKNAHRGDAQGINETVSVLPPEHYGNWAVRATSAYTSTNPEIAGTHPVVYNTAGKHHFLNERNPSREYPFTRAFGDRA